MLHVVLRANAVQNGLNVYSIHCFIGGPRLVTPRLPLILGSASGVWFRIGLVPGYPYAPFGVEQPLLKAL